MGKHLSTALLNGMLSCRVYLYTFALSLIISADILSQPIKLKVLAPESSNFLGIGNMLFYSSGDTLWKSNGHELGTIMVKDLEEPILNISSITLKENVFIITQTGTDQSLWRSGGTEANTIKVGTFKSILPAIVYNDNLILSIDDGVSGREPWKLSGTTLTQIKDINPGPEDGFIGEIVVANDSLFFFGTSGTGRDIWKSNGHSNATSLVVDLPFDDAQYLTAVNETVYFTRDYPDPNNSFDQVAELWKFETMISTQATLVHQFENAYQFNELTGLRQFKEKLYFIRHHDLPIDDLMYSDGAGVNTVKQVALDGSTGALTEINGLLFFATETQGYPMEIIRSDGTTEGTYRFLDLGEAYHTNGDLTWLSLTATDDMLFFVHDAADPPYRNSRDLWQSDLSVAMSVRSIYGTAFEGSDNLVAAEGNSIFFTTQSAAQPLTLWFYNADESTTCTKTGGIQREVWANVPGSNVSQIPVLSEPDNLETITSFQGPGNVGDKYGSRYRGYLCIRETGNYRFFLASNDNSELWLSISGNPADKVRIAYVSGSTNVGQYDKYTSQQSEHIKLTAGVTYYIEGLHKEGVGTDHFSVAIELPDGTLESPIAGARLIPYEESCAVGKITREVWTRIAGSTVTAIPLNTIPDATSELTIFETPSYQGTHYGERLRGYICPPSTGSYVFYISSNDHSQLWLSSDRDPANKVQIASVIGATGIREWNKYASQISSPVWLDANRRYYIEALHKQGVGSDNLAVGWILPDGTEERPIPGSRLSPFEIETSIAQTEIENPQIISADAEVEESISLSPNPVSLQPVTLSLSGYEFSESDVLDVEIISSIGGVVYKSPFRCREGCNLIKLEAGELSPGIYVVTGTINRKRFSQRLVVK